MQNRFDVELFIAELLQINEECKIEADLFTRIDRLCKKVDVVKIVYKFYTSDLSKKNTDLEISAETYKSLLDLLILFSKKLNDFKFINTALKLNDILLKRNIVSSEKAKNNLDKLSFLINTSFESVVTQ